MDTNTANTFQIVATIASIITSAISVIIAMKSLRLTNKSIIDANRPYVVVYSDFMQISSTRMNYLVIKNYGKSSATIDRISFSNDDFYADDNKPFYNFSNCSIAPNQFYSCRVRYKRDPYTAFEATIEYHDNMANYKETFAINTEALAKQLVQLTTSSSQGELEKTISITAQEIIRRNF